MRRGLAGQLGQEKVEEEEVEVSKKSFRPEKFSSPAVDAAAPRAERGGWEARQGSARKGPETEPTAAVRPPQALLPE